MLYLKVPELHSRVSVLEHELWFPAMTLGSTDLYVLHDFDSTRIYVGGHSEDVLTSLKKHLFFFPLLFGALPLEMIKPQEGF